MMVQSDSLKKYAYLIIAPYENFYLSGIFIVQKKYQKSV